MFCPFQNRAICVFLNIQCSGGDYRAYCFKMLCVPGLSFKNLTNINLNIDVVVPLYLSISGKRILGDRLSSIIHPDILSVSEIQQILR